MNQIFNSQSLSFLYPGANDLLEDFAIRALLSGEEKEKIIDFMVETFSQCITICQEKVRKMQKIPIQ